MLKQMKELDEHNKKKYGKIMSIPTYKSLSININPEHDDKPYNAYSGEI